MKRFSGIAASVLLALGATGGANAAQQFVIGVSNTHIGNSWREEFVCSIKAEALASGLVSKVVLANREAGPSEQIADLRTMISAGVNAIIINPSDEKALNGGAPVIGDSGPHLIEGYGPSVWNGSIALVETTASEMAQAYQSQVDMDTLQRTDIDVIAARERKGPPVDADFQEVLQSSLVNL